MTLDLRSQRRLHLRHRQPHRLNLPVAVGSHVAQLKGLTAPQPIRLLNIRQRERLVMSIGVEFLTWAEWRSGRVGEWGQVQSAL